MKPLRRLSAVALALSVIMSGALVGAAPAQAAPMPAYRLCNSGNSVSIVEFYDTWWPHNVRIVLPGSSNCRSIETYNNEPGGLRIDPDYSDVDNQYYDDVKRWRIRPGNSDTYGPWHCGEAHIDPPDAWQSVGIDIQTSGSNGTTC